MRHTLPFIAALVLAAPPGPARAAEPAITTAQYLCDRGAIVWASYVNAGDSSFAVIGFEGRQLGFDIAASASGARYLSTSAEAPYVWWTRGDSALMLFGTGDDEAMIYSECLRQPG